VRPRSKAVRISLAILYFVCISVIVGWSLRQGASAAERAVPPSKPVESDRDTAIVPAKPSAVTGKVRGGGDCPGCGVVESVRRIETYAEIMEACPARQGGGSPFAGYGLDPSRHQGAEPLADIVSAAAVGKRGAKRFAVTTRHQIVVRFRDGSRQVLNESTPRALHEGERVIVIAGLGGTSS
jgi:hypothetical protein